MKKTKNLYYHESLKYISPKPEDIPHPPDSFFDELKIDNKTMIDDKLKKVENFDDK